MGLKVPPIFAPLGLWVAAGCSGGSEALQSANLDAGQLADGGLLLADGGLDPKFDPVRTATKAAEPPETVDCPLPWLPVRGFALTSTQPETWTYAGRAAEGCSVMDLRVTLSGPRLAPQVEFRLCNRCMGPPRYLVWASAQKLIEDNGRRVFASWWIKIEDGARALPLQCQLPYLGSVPLGSRLPIVFWSIPVASGEGVWVEHRGTETDEIPFSDWAYHRGLAEAAFRYEGPVELKVEVPRLVENFVEENAPGKPLLCAWCEGYDRWDQFCAQSAQFPPHYELSFGPIQIPARLKEVSTNP